jgi:hypothetical protein
LSDVLRHAAEVRRCLVELDVVGMRRLHAHVWPHYPAPKTDDEALHSMHLARVQMKDIPERCRQYSQAWLFERQGMQAKAVGVACKSLSSDKFRLERASNRQQAMVDAVDESIKAGIDIDSEAHEVRRRMMIAKRKA